jgi:hypothetical protein
VDGHVPPIRRRAPGDRFQYRLADARLHGVGGDSKRRCRIGRTTERLIRPLERTEPSFDRRRDALLRNTLGLAFGDLALQ